MVDIHNHILPGIDDGAENIEEALALLRLEIKNDVDTVIFTPHFNSVSSSLDEFLEKRNNACELLKQAASYENLNINFVLGAEIYFSPEILNLDLDALSLGKSDYMLIEFPFHHYPAWAPEVFYQLILRGKTPIIAHVERYSFFEQNPELLYNHIESGCFAQINADAAIKIKSYKFLKKCISHNLVHFVASDTHSVKGRPPRIKEALKAVDKRFPGFSDFAKQNAQSVVENSSLFVSAPIDF